MTIYLDIVLLENFVINYIILLATGIINKTKIKVIKLAISSAIGALYAVLSFTSNLQIYEGVFLKILLSVAMIYIAFKPERMKTLFKQLMLFYLVSFAFGGTAFALLYYIRPQDILMKNGVLIGTYPIKIAILGAIIGAIIAYIASKGIKNKLNKKDMFCEINIKLDSKVLKVKAMIDTGNMLKEPITGAPVIIVEDKALEDFFPEQILVESENIINGNLSMVDDKYVVKLKVIPFTSLGKQNGMLLGIKADEAEIITEENVYIINNVVVGIYDKPLTKNGKYNALIGLDILEGGTNELIREAKT